MARGGQPGAKPFSPTELADRIRAALRRRETPGRPEHRLRRRGVIVARRPVHMTATEYLVLFELSVRADRVLTNRQLLQRVWGLKKLVSTEPVREIVNELRHMAKGGGATGDETVEPELSAVAPSARIEEGRGHKQAVQEDHPHVQGDPESPGRQESAHCQRRRDFRTRGVDVQGFYPP